MDFEKFGIDPQSGGSTLITLAKVTGHRSYTGKDGQPKFVTSLIWNGGNQDQSTPPDHPLYQAPIGKLVLMSQAFLNTPFGWKGQGQPQLHEHKTK